MQIEDHHKLLTHAKRIYRCVDLEHHSVLGQYRSRLDALNMEKLQEIVYEVMSSHELDANSNMFTNYIQNLISHKRRELNSLILEYQDEAAIRKCRNLK